MTGVAQAKKAATHIGNKYTGLCAPPPSCVAVERLREHKYEKNAV